MMRFFALALLAVFLASSEAGSAIAEEVTPSLSLEAALTTDFISNVSGGARRGSVFEGNVDLAATLDTGKAGLWDEGTLFVYVLGNFGEAATKFVGDTQSTSNIEAPEAIKLYEMWYEQKLFDSRLSLLTGLYDYNSEFNVLEYASSLRHSSFGIEPDISQVVPSIFPTTALAVRGEVQLTGSVLFRGAVFDGVPGNPENPRGTHIILDDEDGLFWAGELEICSGESPQAGYYKGALGGWYQTTDFEDFAGRTRSSNGGLYVIAEASLWSPDGETSGLGGFFQFGIAEGDRNQIADYVGAGFSYTGLLPGRVDDTTAFGVAYARNGSGYVSAGDSVERGETALELSYALPLCDAAVIQPDIQYVFNPGTDPAQENALVLAVRLTISL